MANTSILAAFERMWQHVIVALGNKSDINHIHDDYAQCYAQNDEPIDAQDGTLWIDLDETSSTGASGGISVANNAGAHNAVYRGKCLGDTITQEQYDSITAGTFDDLFIGDYWVINGYNFRIAAFDYYYGTGDEPFNKHHAVIVPDSCFDTAVMNDEAITSTGYSNTKMRTYFLSFVYQGISAFLGDHLPVHKQYITSDNYGNGIWEYSTLELMTEQNVYGSIAFSTAQSNHRTIDCTQFPLFRYRPDLIRDPNVNYWLRDIASETEFAMVCTLGNCDKASANEVFGIRPAFTIA